MYEPVFIFKDGDWQDFPKEEYRNYEYFVFAPSLDWNSQIQQRDLQIKCYGNYNTIGKAKTKITVCTHSKNKNKFRVMAKDLKSYNFYPLDIGRKYTDRALWNESPY